MKRSLHQRWLNIAVNAALATLVVVPVYAASTIGNNISTGGNIILTNGGGNLGVGTSTPANLFSVHGNALISGNVTSVANITATGTLTLSGTTGTSTIASGQGFTIGSSQLVLQQGNGRVGIGTTSPMAALSLNAGQFVTAAGTAAAPSWAFTTDTISGLFLPATSVLGFSTGGSERVRIDSNGRLGIGTTTPGTPLGVTGAGVFTGPLTFTWLNATSTTATSTLSTGGLTVGANQFVVQQTSGSVGIGTTSPASLFSVAGSGYLTGGLGLGALNTTAGTLSLLPAANAASVLAVKNAAGTNIFTVDTLAGGTTTIANFLNVTGAVTSTSTFTGGLAANLLNLTSTTATSTAANGLNLTAGCFAVNAVCVGPGTVLSGTAGQLPYYGSTGTALTATSSIFLTTSSYFGIGTTTPDQLLSLFSATTPSLEFSSASGPTNKWTMGIDTADANKFKIASSTAVGTNPRLTIDGNGNVGIGTTTPSRLFSVHGNALISGTSYFGAAITATSTLDVTGLTTMGNATATALTVGSATGNLYVNGYATTTGANGNIATAGTLDVIGLTTLGNASTTQIGSTNSAYFGTTGGNVGIATTSPWGRAAVEQGTETYSFVVSNTASSSPSFAVNGVNGDGRVGIGTTTPYARFSVQSESGITGTDAFVVATSSRAAVFGIDNDGHRFTSGPAPALSSCGTSPTVIGSDSGGTVTAGTGSPTACTLTFAKAYRMTPYCNVNTGANTASSSVTSISTTAVTFSIVPTVNSIALYYSCAYHQ